MKNEHDIEEIEENFDEAVKNVNNVLVHTKVSSHALYKQMLFMSNDIYLGITIQLMFHSWSG